MQDNNIHTASVITDIDNAIHQLDITGLNTVFDVAAESEAQFIEKMVKDSAEPGLTEKAKTLYQQAKAEARHRQAAKRATQLRNDPVLNRINKLAFTAAPDMPMAKIKAKSRTKLTGDIPERAEEYADPKSIQSLFSPGHYLCELYGVAKELHEENNSLHIDKRRPDLKDLLLNDSNMNQDVSSLDILLDVLQKKVSLADLTRDTKAQANDASFTLPYDDNLTVINAVLQDKSTSLREIATLLTENNDPWVNTLTPALVQEQLGLNPASYALIEIAQELDESSAKRLAHATQLSVEQLQWLNKNAIENSSTGKDEVLAIISEYHRLNQRYGLSVDQFIAIINDVNTETKEKDESSFFQQVFSTLDVDAGFNFLDQGSWEVIIRKALSITAEELLRIAEYCFGKNSISNVKMNSKKFSQLYRMAMIPRILGLSFSQAEYLWQLYNNPDDPVMEKIAHGDALTMINAITLLENTLQWMNQQKLDIATLQAMLTTQYSTAATPELFNFLSNIYHTLGKQVYSDTLKPNLCRSLANGFHLKTNVVAGLVSWLENNNVDFTLESFWQNIAMTFAEEPSLHQLEVHQPLIMQCQQLSQYALIAQWAALSEQEIELILLPNGLDNRNSGLTPTLALLKLLSEFKLWQQATEVPQSELLDAIKEQLTNQKEKEKSLISIAQYSVDSSKNEVRRLEFRLKNLIAERREIENKRHSDTMIYSPSHLYNLTKINFDKQESNKKLIEEEKIKLTQAETNLKTATSSIDRDKITIERLAKIYHCNISLTKEAFTILFNENIKYGFESIVLLKAHIDMIEKLNISPETLLKTKNYIFNNKDNTLEDIANKLMVNL
jgi:Salmonella virulence plasmid 28.1kDa A protein